MASGEIRLPKRQAFVIMALLQEAAQQAAREGHVAFVAAVVPVILDLVDRLFDEPPEVQS